MVPSISVVMATYNRSRSLACAIDSVRRQQFADWELVVVGDACTDDTAEVVARFGDRRIRFINLRRNFTEQAGPNNVGVAESRGALIAFLNHDDVWFPDHLQLLREALLGHQADLVFGTAVTIDPASPTPIELATVRTGLVGLGEQGRYSPAALGWSVVPASAWLLRRELFDAMRGWRLSRDTVVEPSQDFLFRAWRGGFQLRSLDLVTLVIVASGHRTDSYVSNQAMEQEWVLDSIEDPGFRAELVARTLETNSAFTRRVRQHPGFLSRAAATALARAGVNPRSAQFRMRGMSRGDYVRLLRARRGLKSSTQTEPGPALRYETVERSCSVELPATIDFGAGGGGSRFLAFGWSRPESSGVWNDGDEAELLFKTSSTGQVEMVLHVRPFLGWGESIRSVEVWLDDISIATWHFGPTAPWIRKVEMPLPGAVRPLRIRLRFLNPESPRSLGLSDDPRLLSLMIVRAELRVSS